MGSLCRRISPASSLRNFIPQRCRTMPIRHIRSLSVPGASARCFLWSVAAEFIARTRRSQCCLLGAGMGAKVFPKALPTAGLGRGAAGPVVLQVGVLFTYEPTDGVTYGLTDGATADPYPESPTCASATVLERAKAVASAIVLSFMRCPSYCFDKRQP